MQVRELMSAPAVTVGPGTPARYAAEVLADRGFAALPVLDDQDRLVGIVAEADLLVDRVPPDPRLHERRDSSMARPAALVGGVMTSAVQSVEATADVSDVARLLVDGRLRSLPVLDHGEVVGVVSRRDLLRSLVRPDADVATDVQRLVDAYTGEPGSVQVSVVDGSTTIIAGAPGGGAGTVAPAHSDARSDARSDAESDALRTLAHTVAGVVRVTVQGRPPDPSGTTGTTDTRPEHAGSRP